MLVTVPRPYSRSSSAESRLAGKKNSNVVGRRRVGRTGRSDRERGSVVVIVVSSTRQYRGIGQSVGSVVYLHGAQYRVVAKPSEIERERESKRERGG